jgi:hypothetical protein
VAKLRVATELIIAGHPAVGHLIPPFVEHLPTLLVPRLVTNEVVEEFGAP